MSDHYSFVFPEYLITEGSNIIIYGAHDMGRDYAKQIQITQYCNIIAFADKAKAGLHLLEFEILAPDDISNYSFDYVLIASSNYHKEIYRDLKELGVPENKIKYAEIRSLTSSTSVISNLCLEYFVAKFEHRSMKEEFISHPIQKMIISSLEQYDSAGIPDSAAATKKLIDDISVCDRYALTSTYEDERYYYGNAYTLMNYGNYKWDDWNSLPNIHHSVLMQRADSFLPAFSPILISTPYHRQFYQIPIIEVGPYIRYAEPHLDRLQTEKLKRKLGKMLVAFPMHNDMFWNADYNEEQFNQYLIEEKKNFDSVIVCLHVFDLTTEKINYYKDKGIIPISLGVRMDQRYLSKLRSVLEISEVVVTNYIGAVLNHATAMRKTVKWFHSDDVKVDEIPNDQKIPNCEEGMRKLLDLLKHRETLSDEAIACCEQLYRQKTFRTPEEMNAIFEINKEIYNLSHKDRALYQKCTGIYLEDLKKSNDPKAELKYRLLRESMEDK